jgi:hypothetical protein
MMIFLGSEDIHGAWRGGQKMAEEATSLLGAPQGGRPEGLWAPRGSPNPNSCSINPKILPNQQKHPPKYFSATASLCSCEIPSWGLFRYPAEGGFDHGGLLHQPCCPFDEA